MAHEFRLPDIGEGLTEAEIVRWVVPVGESVELDETVVEVETDKAVVEIPSPFAGVVLHHGAAEGEIVEVGQILVVVGEPGEEWAASGSEMASVAEDSGENTAAPIVGTLSEEAEELPSRRDQIVETITSVKALPLVRKLAKDLGVDVGEIDGSGPGGRITRDDVMTAAEAAGGPVVEPPPPTLPPVPSMPSEREDTVPAGSASGADERRPLTRLRRTIAANMSRSWAEVPHVTTFDDVDATRLMAMRSALSRRHDTRVPVEALVVKAVVPVLVAFPEFNSTLEDEELVVHRRHDIGIAVDTDEGLLVAVIDGADRRSVLELSEEVRRLGEAAKRRELSASELTGQTFTVSNIGALGGGHGTPIVPPGTTAILSVGRADDKPVVRKGRVEIAPRLPLSLSYDHRVIDGGMGRRFMAMLIENLEEPGLFLAD